MRLELDNWSYHLSLFTKIYRENSVIPFFPAESIASYLSVEAEGNFNLSLSSGPKFYACGVMAKSLSNIFVGSYCPLSAWSRG